MRKHLCLSICIYFALSLQPGLAQDLDEDLEMPRQIKVLEWLVSDWKASGKNARGEAYEDFYRFRLNLSGEKLTTYFSRTIAGKIVWQDRTTLSWNSKTKSYLALNHTPSGTKVELKGSLEKGDVLVFQRGTTHFGPFKAHRVRIKKSDENSLSLVVELLRDKKYTAQAAQVFKRIPGTRPEAIPLPPAEPPEGPTKKPD